MKKIIIIGATSGIGLEVARCYLKDGWQVGVAGRREEELEKIRLSAPGQVCTQTIDVTREDAPFSLEQLITKMGGMDVFLLSSGIGKQNLSLQPDIELQFEMLLGKYASAADIYHLSAKEWRQIRDGYR